MLAIIKLPAAFGWNSKADDVYIVGKIQFFMT
jgi:hypothetical protein